MITAKFFKREDKILGFQISGHAGYAECGHDIVCSAVSTLGYTFLNGITDVLSIKPEYEIKDDDGFMRMSFKDSSKEDIIKAQVLMQTMLLGMENLKILYGDYIKVVKEEV
ncbi:hypothetical protein SAMN02745248_00214 [Hathewaya proteolytica DSM 3090]|uniref:Ribosomal processing cysteine protease Prp n=1 Tax=Hathewaya proteolytica DSM 3090 TaxID=1121331 RepID=A0A1M6JJD8_9CLOT|nr:ribosomal-processing cysteine protease Prp [Hathewaya proteolytica]SHJ46773.1 hypothetical protein SAMN02745248_00214 [Hathewaya proteolytica DSM 3090]